MKTPPAAILEDLAPAEQAAFTRVFAGPPSTPEELRAQLSTHGQEIEAGVARNEFLDTRAAGAIARRLADLLDEWDTLTSAHRAVVQAAVAYYVLREDAEDDLDSVLGFEDDVAVVNACLRFLGRTTLSIETT